jgi:hypothetical protein
MSGDYHYSITKHTGNCGPQRNRMPSPVFAYLALIAPHDISTASRALYRAIEGLERHRAARKAREESAASMDAEPAKRPAGLNEGNPRSMANGRFLEWLLKWLLAGFTLGRAWGNVRAVELLSTR